ncbi:MBL fold metallo-hydrolase [Bacillus sp. HMF5848]|uniref:MBL fold metallo-hydrolase n=1 Tax=Bacillus sp. HMF5848 TaxID=2495421 RepID=UPI000F79C1CF|nr:MBL fold metallo-hydrolase [Bacillus sp. HMF5848]RSK26009.1 MBL fold metallo-hydrolase [Bacillus sp. HMF5848]
MDTHSIDQAMIPPLTSVTSGIGIPVTQDVFSLPTKIVNVCFIGDPTASNSYILVDTGMPHCATMIEKAAKDRFGNDAKLTAIILTHGHFDHIGSIGDILSKHPVPVYVHSLERPYVTGEKQYPPANPGADEGLIAKLSPMFPREPINIAEFVQVLPEDHSVPNLPDWKWIHTPGHTPGHISLYKESDRTLIAGDAFTTVKQEELYSVISQDKEINGPPAYFTADWAAAEQSVKTLARLQPAYAITGHGVPISGSELTEGLEQLANNFASTQIPKNVH